MGTIIRIIQIKFMDQSNQEIFWGIFWVFLFVVIVYAVVKSMKKP